jgi:ribonucleoside-diphosphate reductase alpha chain
MTRKHLQDRRYLTRQRASINGQKFYFDVGFYDEEKTQVGEIFFVLQKTGAQERALFDEIARSASKRLQRGEPLADVALSWLGTKLLPAGPVEGDARVKFCQGPLDYVGRHLLIQYCDRPDLAHVTVST